MVKFSQRIISRREPPFASEKDVVDGVFELAALLLESYAVRFGRTEPIAKTERLAYLNLTEKYRSTDPPNTSSTRQKSASRSQLWQNDGPSRRGALSSCASD
jgi:hypothetical protein